MATLPDGSTVEVQHDESWNEDLPLVLLQHDDRWNEELPAVSTRQFEDFEARMLLYVKFDITPDRSALEASETVTLSGAVEDELQNPRSVDLVQRAPDGTETTLTQVEGTYSEEAGPFVNSGDYEFYLRGDGAGTQHTEGFNEDLVSAELNVQHEEAWG